MCLLIGMAHETQTHCFAYTAKAKRIFAKYSLASTVVPYFLTHRYTDSSVFKYSLSEVINIYTTSVLAL